MNDYNVQDILRRALESGNDEIVWLCTDWARLAKEHGLLSKALLQLTSLIESSENPVTLFAALQVVKQLTQEEPLEQG